MKKTVQLLAFLVTAGIVFSSASYKGFDSYFVYWIPNYPIEPLFVEECAEQEIHFRIESTFGTSYWAVYDLRWARFVKGSDLWPGQTIMSYIYSEGYYSFTCRQIFLIHE
ncbi:hypothetical protein [Gynurincola endophyticus]|uniref:hypothetical protein n=1 Tax=Gynurincola endophyticus TaxID=2479004 RepID=UPI000F8C50DD|nr:hypothetical protein [Gynurincola endophyticus]